MLWHAIKISSVYEEAVQINVTSSNWWESGSVRYVRKVNKGNSLGIRVRHGVFTKVLSSFILGLPCLLMVLASYALWEPHIVKKLFSPSESRKNGKSKTTRQEFPATSTSEHYVCTKISWLAKESFCRTPYRALQYSDGVIVIHFGVM